MFPLAIFVNFGEQSNLRRKQVGLNNGKLSVFLYWPESLISTFVITELLQPPQCFSAFVTQQTDVNLGC